MSDRASDSEDSDAQRSDVRPDGVHVGPSQSDPCPACCRWTRVVSAEQAALHGHPSVWQSRVLNDDEHQLGPFDCGFEEVTLVSRLCYRTLTSSMFWAPWVIKAQSKLLRTRGVFGWGLYAARTFHSTRWNMKPDIIGRYTGRRLPHEGASFHTSMQARIAAKLYLGSLEDGPGRRDALYDRHSQHGEHDFQIIDGSHGGEPLRQMINSPFGSGVRPNLKLTPNGNVIVIPGRSGHRIPRLRLKRSLRLLSVNANS